MPIRPVPSVARRRACRTLLAIPFLILAGCATGAAGTSARMQVPVMLQRQAEAWNAGDIDAFMEPYWRSPDLTFTSSYGPTVHLRLLSTPPHGDAVTFGYRPESACLEETSTPPIEYTLRRMSVRPP
ncbi:MAG: hypothetical protein IID36_07530 [Planctomycetes bacterium]|nr:hypothetical protein [Planctomycetota bacterium]